MDSPLSELLARSMRTSLCFAPSAAERELAEAVEAFARDHVAPQAAERSRRGAFSADLWRAAAEFGLTGAGVTDQAATSGPPARWAPALPLCLVLEALQYGGGDGGFTLSVGAHLVLCALPVARFSTADQRARLLPGLIDGSLVGALAITEPGHGSDSAGIEAAAAECEGGYRLTGVKTYVSNGSIADVIIVLARTRPGTLGFGLTALLVEPATMPGVTATSLALSGYRSACISRLEFDSVTVPRANVLGRVGAGFHTVARHCFELEQSVMLAPEVGEMRRCLDLCLDFAAGRDTANGKLITLGQTQRRLADMAVRLETARMAVYRSAWEQDAGGRAKVWGPLAKKVVAQNALRNAADAIQLMGAAGALEDGPIARSLAEASLAGIAGGTTELHEQALVAALVQERR